MSNITVPEKDIYFWTGFYNDEDCVSWASNKAYLDMNRTMTFKEEIPKNNSDEEKRIKKQRATWVEDCTNIIRSNFNAVQKDFNTWHADTCDQIIKYYDKDKLVLRNGTKRTNTPAELTYGQAQKWVNMTLKYLWLLNRLNLINDPNISTFIKKHEKSFHVPLDSYILKYVARRDKSKKEPFSPKNKNALNRNVNFNTDWESFKSTWSAIEDADKYYNYQSKLASAIEDNISPLEWELEHWHKALKYYG
jgi:hypothetical protein